jgi:hypothetical protein
LELRQREPKAIGNVVERLPQLLKQRAPQVQEDLGVIHEQRFAYLLAHSLLTAASKAANDVRVATPRTSWNFLEKKNIFDSPERGHCVSLQL